MKVSTMRRIDAWLGVPLCILASIIRKATSRSTPPGPPKSVLVIKLSELGALVTLGPAVTSLAGLVGKENLYFITFGESRALLDILDYAPRENIFALRTGSLAALVSDAVGSLIRLRRKKIDCSLDLDFFSRATALLGWLSGSRQRVGCHAWFGEGPYRGDLLTHRLKFNPHIHVSQMFQILAAAVQRPAGEFPRVEFIPDPAEAVKRRFQPSASELAAVERIVGEAGARPFDTLILLNSNISDRESIPLRKWPDEQYVELAKLIVDGAPSSFVLLTGGASEVESIARLEASVCRARCRSIAGKTTLRELLALYTRSAILVTNDSGPAHFATLTDIGVVVLFGPESPMLWRPLGDQVKVIYRSLGCSPCFSVYNGRQSACRRNICMDIAPAEVYEVVLGQLAKRRRTSAGP